MKVILSWTVGIFLLFSVVSIPITTLLKSECIETSEVTDVGGCDRYGNCGVRLKNGSSTNVRLPTIGDHICSKRISEYDKAKEIRWDWWNYILKQGR